MKEANNSRNKHRAESFAGDVVRSVAGYRHTSYGLLGVSIALGVSVGLCVVLFRLAMRTAEDGFGSLFLSATASLPGGRYLFPLLTALGGLGVGILGQTIFKHGHEEGMHGLVVAIKERAGRMHWISSLKAVVGAALTIGSGGGGGKEGPVILLGSSVGSALGQLAKLKPDALRTLCAAGAAAAISGIFNAPLAGIIFAVEAIYGEIVMGPFISVVVASVLSTAVRRLFIADQTVIDFSGFIAPSPEGYVFIGLVGLSCGFVSYYYLRIYHAIHRWFSIGAAKLPKVFRPMIGGLAAGCIATALPTMLEMSYRPVSDAIAGRYGLAIALASFLVKPISNAVTLSSGGSGGTFAPSIKAGAMWGLAVSLLCAGFMPALAPGLLAVACAAAVLAGTWRIPLTAAVLLTEATQNFEILLPLLFATVLSVFVVGKIRSAPSFNPLETKD